MVLETEIILPFNIFTGNLETEIILPLIFLQVGAARC